MNAFFEFINVLSTPLVILNIFGEVVSGVWLLIIGEWRLVVLGVIAIVVSSFVLGLLMMPSLLFAGLASVIRGNGGKMVPVVLSTLYTALVMTAWCVASLWVFGTSATLKNVVPLLIWSYGVAVGPWANMARKDQAGQDGNMLSMISVFFAEFGYLVAMVMFLTRASTFGIIMAVIAGFLLAAQVVNWFILGAMLREETRRHVDLFAQEEDEEVEADDQ